MSEQTPLIQVSNVSKKFGKLDALCDVSLTINQGEIIALLGANGAGKTTLINHLLGRLTPDSGNISIAGYKPGSLPARQRIGTILQSAKMPETLTIEEHIVLFSSYYLNPLPLAQILNIAGLTDLRKRRFKALSGGQQQRLFFALAICGNPQVVLLDEPTVGLDVQARRQFWQCIRELAQHGTSVLLTTHYLEEADALAEKAYLLSQGKLLHEGTCDSLKNKMGGKVIRFKTSSMQDFHTGIAGITQVQSRGQFVELVSQCAEDTLGYLFAQKIELHDLTVSQVSLEDAFLQMSSNSTPEHQLDNIKEAV
ncbi:ABC transporter ATP-binding protein [Glaciecola sp. 1036]|uniref:ABC transporter ATP-binding protein n=1 Tax=Alteromonadaceae TaxID=72275 RepID=UPI003D08F6F5